MSLILLIETATNVCSVALAEKGKLLGYKEELKEGTSHSLLVTSYIDTLLKTNHFKASDLSAVAISAGPGSYTGLRIGCSVAKAICYTLKIPLIAISTLQALAWKAQQTIPLPTHNVSNVFLPMLDARRMDVYTIAFDQNLKALNKVELKRITSNTFESLTDTYPSIYFFGNGAAKCLDHLTHSSFHFLDKQYCSATNMPELAHHAFCTQDFQDTAYFEPSYLSKYIPNISKKNIL